MAEEPKDLPQGESMAASDTTTDSPHESELQDTVSAGREEAAVAPARSDTKSMEPKDETFWEDSVDASTVNLAEAGTAPEEKEAEPAAEDTPESGDAPLGVSEENTTGEATEEAITAEGQNVSDQSEAPREQSAPADEDPDQLTTEDEPQQVKDSDTEIVADKEKEAAVGDEEGPAEGPAEGAHKEPQENELELLPETEPEGEESTPEKTEEQDASEGKAPGGEAAAIVAADPAEAAGEGKKPRWRPTRKAAMIAAGILLLIIGSVGFSVVFDLPSGDTVSSTFPGKQPENAYGMKFFLPLNVGYEEARFVKVTIAIELTDKGFKNEIDEHVSQLRQEVIDLLLTKSPQEVKSAQGKNLLRQEITARLNNYLATDCIKDTYFTELVIL
jgi:flagellar FliL protein